MLHVGLTGNVGAGKSTVVALFESRGAAVIDTDALAREVVAPGQPGLSRIRELWGDRVIDQHGGLDRTEMRRIVFSDPEQRRQLESVLHPLILDRFRELVAEAEARGDRILISVVPLLYEVGMEAEFHVIVLVDAPLDLRIERIVAARDLGQEEARALAAAQMPADEKRSRAHLIIDNDSDITALERRAWEAWKEIEKMATST